MGKNQKKKNQVRAVMRNSERTANNAQSDAVNTRSLRTALRAPTASRADTSIGMSQLRDELLQVVVAIDFDPWKIQQRVVKATCGLSRSNSVQVSAGTRQVTDHGVVGAIRVRYRLHRAPENFLQVATRSKLFARDLGRSKSNKRAMRQRM